MTVVRREDVRGGDPVISGTRVSVNDIVERFYDLGRGISVIAEDLEVSEEDVEEALRYYHDKVMENDSSRVEA